jgi:ribosomal protein S18 acetylase RimI-like enzyme
MLVRTFGPDDIPFAAKLSAAEGWGMSAQDLQGLLELEPDGCFVAEENGQPAGAIISVAYGKVGWICNLMVRSTHRRRGHGRALLDATVGYLLDRGVRTVGVDAPLQSVPFYTQAGFWRGFELLHMKRGPLPAPSPATDTVGRLQETDLHAVTVFDWACFGGCRQHVLRSLLASSQAAFLAQDLQGVAGFLMARRREGEWVIGPWVCIRSAEPLLTHALAAIGAEPARLAVPKVNEQALRTLRNHGFTVYYHEMRMYYGDQEGMGHPERIYAIASPQKG